MSPAAARILLQGSVDAYAAAVGSKASAPGAGSVAALVAALAAGLNEKVARLAKDAPSRKLAAKMTQARKRLLRLVDEDARSFAAVMAAWKAEPATRQRALKAATRIPLAVCVDGAMLGDVAGRLALTAKPVIRADALAAEQLAGAASTAARLMVDVNLRLITDASFIEQTRRALEPCTPRTPTS